MTQSLPRLLVFIRSVRDEAVCLSYGHPHGKALIWRKSGRQFVAARYHRRGGECPLLAQSGHPDALNQCPLLGGNADISLTYLDVRYWNCSATTPQCGFSWGRVACP